MVSIVVGRKNGGTTPIVSGKRPGTSSTKTLVKPKGQNSKDTIRLEDTIKSLQLAQSKVSNDYGIHTLRVGSKDIDIKVGRVMKRLELMLQVGDALCNSDLRRCP